MHTHYTLEPASNPPKERGHYVALRKNGLREELEYYPDDNDWSAYTDVIYWYRPLTEEERAKEMGAFAEWTRKPIMSPWEFLSSKNLWVRTIQNPKCFNAEGELITDEVSYTIIEKTTSELFALFTQEREKQKQQKGENNNG